MAALYKKALHNFFLKVHPDFFASQPAQQRVNEASIAQLNELLGWAKEFKNTVGGALRPPPSTKISMSFFLQSSVDNPSASSSGTSQSAITAVFELPQTFAATDANRGIVERSTNKFLRDLLRKAECIDSTAEALSVAEDVAAKKNEVKPLRRPKRYMKSKEPAVKSLLDEASEAMVASWTLTATPTMEDLMESDQVLFSRTLSPLQSASAMNTIRVHLPEMMYERWQNMPVLIKDSFGVGDISGTISIPWDFTLPQFYAFLNQNDKAIQQERQKVDSFAKKIEVLIVEICNELEVDDVLISCSHKAALPCLELLRQHVQKLARHNVTKVTLEIGSKFSTRANGVVTVPHSMTYTEFVAWLEVIQSRMPTQQKLYLLGKQMLESTMWHLKQFREVVEPAGVDAFDNDCTYHERNAWAKELCRISGSLAQWDWSEFTFSIGPLDVDWEKKSLMLPHNFDGAAFVRYVEGVHEEAKQKKRDELLKESAMAREQQEQLALQRSNSRALEEELAKEFPEASHADSSVQSSTSPTSTSSSNKSISQSLNKYMTSSSEKPSKANAEQVTKKSADLAAAMPHLEEYMASSATKIDPLSVERPLHHNLTFASDEEAKDQLLWEGFYDQPYVPQAGLSDEDDIERAYLATNRFHREKAAKELVEELQSKYGSKKKRFDHIKMGDLLGINNPKIQPKGFPIVSPGLSSEASRTQKRR